MSIHDPSWVPVGMDPEFWSAIPEGVRIRALKHGALDLVLGPDEFLEVAALPFWMCYGPENGLPEDWFNPSGYLLPKYRPGGGLYEEFRSWRHEFRRMRWREYLRRRRLRAVYQRVKGFEPFLYFLAVMFIGYSIQTRFVSEPGEPHGEISAMLVYIGAMVGLSVGLALFKARYPWVGE